MTCPYTPQQNGMAEREMRTSVESVRTMLLHVGVQHHCSWFLSSSAVGSWRRKITGGFIWVWKAKYGPASGRTQADPPTDTSTATVPLLTKVNEPADEDVVEVLPPSPILAPLSPVADQPALTSVSATGDEGSLEASPVALASGIVGGRQGAKLVDQDGKPSTTGEQQTGEPVEQEATAGVRSTREQQAGQSTGEQSKSAGGEQLVEAAGRRLGRRRRRGAVGRRRVHRQRRGGGADREA
ncbi:unnamed protein product [Closterium sp. NIES-54]